jgi:hypothetical protein
MTPESTAKIKIRVKVEAAPRNDLGLLPRRP